MTAAGEAYHGLWSLADGVGRRAELVGRPHPPRRGRPGGDPARGGERRGVSVPLSRQGGGTRPGAGGPARIGRPPPPALAVSVAVLREHVRHRPSGVMRRHPASVRRDRRRRAETSGWMRQPSPWIMDRPVSMTILGPTWTSPERSRTSPATSPPTFGRRRSTAGPHGPSFRVVHLGKFFHPAHGGIERTVRSLAHEQAMLGCSVRVICMDHERGRATRVERDGPVEVVRLRRATSFGKLDHCPDLARLIRDSEADLLHLHTPNPSMILGLMLSGDRRPLVVSHYSDVVKQRLRRLLFSPIERACYDRARLVLSVSSPYMAGSSVLRRCADRVAVLPIGLDLAPFLDPSPEVVARGERPEALASRPALVLLRPAGVLQGPGDRDARPAVGPRHLADRRRRAVAAAAGTARGAAGSRGPGPVPGQDPPRRGPHRPPPGRGRLLVPLERPQRGVRAGAGRGDGERLPGDQRRDPAQRRALGQPPRGDGPDGAGGRPGRVRRRGPPAPGGARPARPPGRRRPGPGDRRIPVRGDGPAVDGALLRRARGHTRPVSPDRLAHAERSSSTGFVIG